MQRLALAAKVRHLRRRPEPEKLGKGDAKHLDRRIKMAVNYGCKPPPLEEIGGGKPPRKWRNLTRGRK